MPVNRIWKRTRTLAATGFILGALALVVPVVAWAAGLGAVALPPGKENTSIIVQNVGSAPATIAVDYYDSNGQLITSNVKTNVPPGGTRNFPQAVESGLAAGYRGVGVVSSDQPINAILVRDILDASGNKSYSIDNSVGVGGSKLSAPILFNELVTSQWNSRLAIVNTGGVIACIRVTYFLVPNVGGAATTNQSVVDSPTGQPGCANGYAVPAGGQVTFGRIGTGVTQFPIGTLNNQMAALVEVLNAGDNKIVANIDIYRSDGNRLLGSYNGFIINDAAPATDDVGTNVIIPLTIKSASGFYTVIGVQNVGTAAADFNIQYIGTDANGNPINVTVTLPGVTNVAFHSIYSSANIPVGFVGYAKVTSLQNGAAVVIRGKQTIAFSGENEATYAAANGVPVDQAALGWNLPLIFRRFAGGGGFIGYNSWIQVQVADGTTASVTLQFVGDPASGCPIGPYSATFTVTGSKVFYMNLDSDNGFPAGNSPSCFFGGAQVTSNKPIIVISNVTSDKFGSISDSDGLYNAFKQ
jgi:hypothetical protein